MKPARALLATLSLSALAGGCLLDVPGVDEGAFTCASDTDCATSAGYRCDLATARCVTERGLPLADGGETLEAGPEDASVPADAGASPGPDAGSMDAGAVDAGAVDAGPSDAGPVDAGPLDAGPLDAGPLDAGQDAGQDAGPIDAGAAAVCGDARIEGGEACDDGNTSANDGCDGSCQEEPGYECVALSPPFSQSFCAPTTEIIHVPGDATNVANAVATVLQNDHRFVFVDGASYDGSVPEDCNNTPGVVISGKAVTLVGTRSPVIASNYDGNTLTITNGAQVTVMGFTIQNGPGCSTDDAVSVEASPTAATLLFNTIGPSRGFGVAVQAGSAVRAHSNIIHHNAHGGLDISTSGYGIEGNFIVDNGRGDRANNIGVWLRNSQAQGSYLRFNTVAGTVSGGVSTKAGGVHCEIPGTLVEASILWDNQGFGNLLGCTPTRSDVQGYISVDGTTLNADPRFVDAAHGDYRIAADSPCVDQGGNAGPERDIDLEPRPQGSGYDVGADEVR